MCTSAAEKRAKRGSLAAVQMFKQTSNYLNSISASPGCSLPSSSPSSAVAAAAALLRCRGCLLGRCRESLATGSPLLVKMRGSPLFSLPLRESCTRALFSA